MDGKSILGVLSLAAVKGSQVEVIVSGEDAQKAFEEIKSLIENGFGEGIQDED
ncbi:MAG: hypothetical protein KatS3mg078_2393 [Deltaproteobacteria bacterium]|nr:MAG: hypothetical protein KatS3mg078_2393 [Deltaproteobacteria bacterium]